MTTYHTYDEPPCPSDFELEALDRWTRRRERETTDIPFDGSIPEAVRNAAHEHPYHEGRDAAF